MKFQCVGGSCKHIKTLGALSFLSVITVALLVNFAYANNYTSVFPYPYTHYAEQENLVMLLTDFARSQGYSASVSSTIKGMVSGRFEKESPFKFLEGMKTAFGVSWYLLGNTLYFYTEPEAQRVFITPRVMTVERLYELLMASDVLSPQLPAKLMNNGEMIVVQGPQSYLGQVVKAVAALEMSQMTNIVMRVFPLKHAWADDITVGSMDRIITIPGIASILRAMLLGAQQGSLSAVIEQPATVEKLSGTGLISRGKAEAKEKEQKANAVPVNLSSIMADPRMNAVIINDAAYKMPYYEEVIRDLDKPLELVEIQAAIVDVDSNYKYSLGVIFQGEFNKNRIGAAGSSAGDPGIIPIKPAPGNIPSPGLGLSTIYTKGADFFLSRIEALETEGEARVLGKPSVLTVDNIQATLENTSTYYIQVQGYQSVDLFKVDAGTVLRVTPHIIKNMNGTRSIKLVVSVEDNQNDDTQDTPITPSNVLPPIKQTKINTQAIVGAGQSLLIGGYYYEQKNETETGVPILMHIPVVGHLFKTTVKSTKQMERLILITPKVISIDEAHHMPMSVEDEAFNNRGSISVRDRLAVSKKEVKKPDVPKEEAKKPDASKKASATDYSVEPKQSFFGCSSSKSGPRKTKAASVKTAPAKVNPVKADPAKRKDISCEDLLKKYSISKQRR